MPGIRGMDGAAALNAKIDEAKKAGKTDVREKWGVKELPAFVFSKDGTVVDKGVGAVVEELESKIKQYASA